MLRTENFSYFASVDHAVLNDILRSHSPEPDATARVEVIVTSGGCVLDNDYRRMLLAGYDLLTSERLKTSESIAAENAMTESVRVFLCHNNKDKPAIQHIAEALELEFGLPHFLDAYAIPTGEEFIPWIERALSESTGCVIFLGANGWGPTHLWEAEKSLLRYRDDPAFKLIPVALPGIRDDDQAKLGAGTLFRDINWADFSTSLDDPVSLEKLRHAMTGEVPADNWTPARLTPYVIRRDARRWRKSDGKDNSILYRGKQLEEARRLSNENPDLVVVEEALPFLAASEAKGRKFLVRLLVASALAIVSVSIAAVTAFVQRGIAEDRRLASAARFLASESQQTTGPDRALLLGVQSIRLAQTPEGVGTLLSQIEHWRHLEHVLHLGGSYVYSLAWDDELSKLLVGLDRGQIAETSLTQDLQYRSLSDMTAASTALWKDSVQDESQQELWVGDAEGRVSVWNGPNKAATVEVASSTEALPPTNSRPDISILSLAGDAEGRWIVAGDATGTLTRIDRKRRMASGASLETDGLRVTSLAFDAAGGRLAAGTDAGHLILVDPQAWQILETVPKRELGVQALAFDETGQRIVVLENGGRISHFLLDSESLLHNGVYDSPSLVTAGAVSSDLGLIAIGDGDGNVFVQDFYGSQESFGSRKAHRASVTALEFDEKRRRLFSGSADGTVYVWQLDGDRGLLFELEQLNPPASAIRGSFVNGPVAANTTLGAAGLWKLAASGWRRTIDLIEESRRIGGDSVFDEVGQGAQVLSDDGFESIDEHEIESVQLSQDGSMSAWVTRSNHIFVAPTSDDRRAISAPESGDDDARIKVKQLVQNSGNVAELNLSATGAYLAYLVDDKVIHSIDVSRRDQLWSVDLPGQARSFDIDWSNARLVTGYEDGRVDLRYPGGAIDREQFVQAHASAVEHVLVSPDGQEVITAGSGGGGADRSIAVHSLPDLELRVRLQTRQAAGSVSALAVSQKYNVLVAGDHSGRLLLWRWPQLQPLLVLQASGFYISSLTITPDGHVIAAGGDGRVVSIELDLQHWIRIACDKANRDLSPMEWQEILPFDDYNSVCGGNLKMQVVKNQRS